MNRRALVARIVAHTGVSPSAARILVRHFAGSPLVYTLRMCFDGPWRWGLCGSKKPRSRRDDLTMFARYLTRLDAGETTEHAQRAVYGTVADLVKIVPPAPYADDWAMPDALVIDVADALKAEKKARSKAARAAMRSAA